MESTHKKGVIMISRFTKIIVLVIIAALIISGCVEVDKQLASSKSNLAPSRLRCEYRNDPLGIDIVTPRLSWIVSSVERDQWQSAYQILVAPSLEDLRDRKDLLFDSGKVISDETICIYYNRILSRSDDIQNQPFYWKVRVWDADNNVSVYSKPARWTIGCKWDDAQWIGYDHPDDNKVDSDGLTLPPAKYLRKDFYAEANIKKAYLYATALGQYQITINGKKIGMDYLNPGWTDYNKRIYYQTFDVTTALAKDSHNAIGAVIADGWFAGYIGYHKERNIYGKNTRLLAKLYILYEDGTEQIIPTDQTWKASLGPITQADMLMGEIYDAQKEMEGWDKKNFDDSLWAAVNTGAELSPEIQAAVTEPIVPFDNVWPEEDVNEPSPGKYVFDMGQNFAGVVKINIRGEKGQKITLRYAERLNADGSLHTQNLRSARATDIYICKGKGKEEWTPQFTYHGFQYVEIDGLDYKPDNKTITGIALSSNTPVVGEFTCSDETIDQLYSNITWTQRMNFMDIPTDCPQRDERLGWTGDAQIYIAAACYNTDVQSFFKKWLIDLRDAQRPDGQFPTMAPLPSSRNDGGPGWADAGVICPWTIYQTYGDIQLLEESYPAMKKYVEFSKNRCSPDLLPPAEFHCFGDWLNINDETPKDVIYMAYFANSTKLTALAAKALSQFEDEQYYNQLFDQIKRSFNKNYVTEDGQVKGDTQTAYVLALRYNILNDDKIIPAAQKLIAKIRERNWHLSTGFLGTKDILYALSDVGATAVAYQLLHNETYPSWGFSVKNGATTIWERWDGWTPEKGFADPSMNSFAHYSFGAVGQWMFQNIGGINAASPSYKDIIIKPIPGGKLRSAKTSYDSIRGNIDTEWSLRENTFKLYVTIPANTSATVYMPTSDPNDVTENGEIIDEIDTVEFLEKQGGYAVYKIGSGSYKFKSEVKVTR